LRLLAAARFDGDTTQALHWLAPALPELTSAVLLFAIRTRMPLEPTPATTHLADRTAVLTTHIFPGLTDYIAYLWLNDVVKLAELARLVREGDLPATFDWIVPAMELAAELRTAARRPFVPTPESEEQPLEAWKEDIRAWRDEFTAWQRAQHVDREPHRGRPRGVRLTDSASSNQINNRQPPDALPSTTGRDGRGHQMEPRPEQSRHCLRQHAEHPATMAHTYRSRSPTPSRECPDGAPTGHTYAPTIERMDSARPAYSQHPSYVAGEELDRGSRVGSARPAHTHHPSRVSVRDQGEDRGRAGTRGRSEHHDSCHGGSPSHHRSPSRFFYDNATRSPSRSQRHVSDYYPPSEHSPSRYAPSRRTPSERSRGAEPEPEFSPTRHGPPRTGRSRHSPVYSEEDLGGSPRIARSGVSERDHARHPSEARTGRPSESHTGRPPSIRSGSPSDVERVLTGAPRTDRQTHVEHRGRRREAVHSPHAPTYPETEPSESPLPTVLNPRESERLRGTRAPSGHAARQRAASELQLVDAGRPDIITATVKSAAVRGKPTRPKRARTALASLAGE
jgi:hypothetical protein